MRRRTIASVMAILAILFSASALGLLFYRRTMPWEHRAYIIPRDAELSSVLMETGFNETSGTKDYGDVGDWRTWEKTVIFTATLTNPDDMSPTFTQFDIGITIDGIEKTLTLATTTQSWTVLASKNGDLLMTLDWTVPDDTYNGSGTAIVIFSADPQPE